MCRPITSCPCSFSRTAATDESTPPLIAIATRAIIIVLNLLMIWKKKRWLSQMRLTTGGNLNILVVTCVIEMPTAVVCRVRSFLL